MNKNVAIIVLGFLARKWFRFNLVEIFGDKGDDIWEQYKNSGLSSYEFFITKLNEEQQNAVTIYAQTLSLAPQNQNEVNALMAMISWPTRMLLNKLKSYLKKEETLHIEQDDVVYDFPCKNGDYTTPITGIGMDRDGDVFVEGLYEGTERLYGYPHSKDPYQILELIQLIENQLEK